jgi:hypothetical protein
MLCEEEPVMEAQPVSASEKAITHHRTADLIILILPFLVIRRPNHCQ